MTLCKYNFGWFQLLEALLYSGLKPQRKLDPRRPVGFHHIRPEYRLCLQAIDVFQFLLCLYCSTTVSEKELLRLCSSLGGKRPVLFQWYREVYAWATAAVKIQLSCFCHFVFCVRTEIKPVPRCVYRGSFLLPRGRPQHTKGENQRDRGGASWENDQVLALRTPAYNWCAEDRI